MNEPRASGATPFADRWIIVSGASSGIGRAICGELAAQGARIVLIGRNVERLKDVAVKLGPSDRTTTRVLDLTNLGEIAEGIREVAAHTGPIYGLCHAAGVTLTLPLSATRPERARAVMDVNFFAGLELARAVVRRETLAEQGGSILWISSVYAHVGAAGEIAYCASKGAVAASVRAMALELAPRRVRVNSVSPGLVRTEMTDPTRSRMTSEQWDRIIARHPLGVGQPDDVARAAAFLLDPANQWITGTDLVIDGGYSLQ
jgi:NAD(P)-dependent dehydrogenase (short-subunit alcohol dehydrogenase family)